MSEENKRDAELRQIVTDALVSMVSGVTGLVPPAGPGQIPDFIQAPIDRAVEKISASLPVGVPDGYALVPVEPTRSMVSAAAGAITTPEDLPPVGKGGWSMSDLAFRSRYRASIAAAPTVKAEQVPTPEFVWVRLVEALAGDNGCAFAASTDDYREAEPALVRLIAAGFFRNDADSLDGDTWMVAAGEQSEVAARFASCADAYAVLSNVLNRVFERDDQAYDRNAERLTAEALGTGSGINMAATSIDELFDESPSLPAAGSADLTAVRCQCCATEYPHDSYDAGFIAGSGMCQMCDAAMPPKDLPAAGSVELPEPDFALDGGCQPCYYAETVQRIVAVLRAQIAARDAAIEEWSGTAVQNGMEVDRLNAALSAQQSDPWAPSGADYDRAIHRNPDAKAWADFFIATFPGQAEAEALRVVLHEIASVNPAERGIEWAKSYASDGLKGAGSELYARWLETFKEAEALRAENARLRAVLAEQGERQEAAAEYQQLSRYGNWDRVDMAVYDLGKLGDTPEKFRALYSTPQPSQDVRALVEAMNFACKSLCHVTSSDGSGHADIALSVLRMAGVDGEERERLVDGWKASCQWRIDKAHRQAQSQA